MNKIKFACFLMIVGVVISILSGCSRRWQTSMHKTHTVRERVVRETQDSDTSIAQELAFDVENKTGKVVYVVGFIYGQRHIFDRWRWHKTRTYRIEPGKEVVIDVLALPSDVDRQSVFGVLGIFETEEAAENSTYELLDDAHKLDLHLLCKLKGKKVVLEVERYGFRKPFYDFDFLEKHEPVKRVPELDFIVENETGKTIFVCGFIYQRKAKTSWLAALNGKDDANQWRFDKTNLLHLEHGQKGVINVDTIETPRDREYVHGFLAVFNDNEVELARTSTFELLDPWRKLTLGSLMRMKDKKIVISVERYGAAGDIVDFVPKSISRIDFTKHVARH